MCIWMDQEDARTVRVHFLQHEPITACTDCGPARTTQLHTLKHGGSCILILSYRLLLYTQVCDRTGFRELLLMTAEERGRKASVCSHWLQLVPSFPTHLHSTCYLACKISSDCQQHCGELSLSPLDCVFIQCTHASRHSWECTTISLCRWILKKTKNQKTSATAKSGLKSCSVILG